MPDLEQLRRLADRVTPPPYDGDHHGSAATRPSLGGDGGDRRRWPHVGLVVAGCSCCAAGVGGAGAGPPRSPLPSPTVSEEPKPSEKAAPQSLESMTPEEVVTAPDAELEAVAVAPGDPDVRISMWHALCHWCPDRPDGRGGILGPPTFTGMAITTDGYATATYVRHPFSGVLSAVHSPRDDLFLVTDHRQRPEWLVGLDGTVRRVERIDDELRPTDPRLWFECGRAGRLDDHLVLARPGCSDGPRLAGGVEPFGRAPAHRRASRGAGPRRAPGRTRTPGRRRGLVGRRRRQAEARARRRRPGRRRPRVPAGDLAYWTWQLGADKVDLHTGRRPGSNLDRRDSCGPWVQPMDGDDSFARWRTARLDDYPHLVVWRAEASGGGFRRVHEARGPELAGAGLWTQDDVVYANGSGTAAVSDDGGLTWTTIQSWR